MTQIIVVGSVNVDLVARASHIPRPGETVLGRDFVSALGGKGANQAVAAARLGAEVTFVARVGADSFGDQCLEGYQEEGINTTFIIRDETEPTGIALIAVADDGENSIIVASGANMRVTPGDVQRAASHFASADALILQLEIPLPAIEQAARLARDHGVPVILNPAPAQHLPSDILELVDVITPNRIELAQLMDLDEEQVLSMNDEALAHAVLSLGPSAGVVTLGAEGALAAGSWGWQRIPAFRVEVVDTTAAGDAFNGGLAVALAQGKNLTEAARYASACGALATTKYGAQPSLPTDQDVQKLLQTASD